MFLVQGELAEGIIDSEKIRIIENINAWWKSKLFNQMSI